jgi:hypothetical protein
MRPIVAITALLIACTLLAAPKKLPAGKAADADVEVAATILDAAALQEATGSDFQNSYTVMQVTVTPKGGKSLELQPDDFLLRMLSEADSTGPMAASQVYGAGGGLVLHAGQETFGTSRNDPGYTGVSVAKNSSSASADQIKALQAKMLPAKKITDPVTGLLFFPVAKKRPGSLDLVYSAPNSKLHIAFK